MTVQEVSLTMSIVSVQDGMCLEKLRSNCGEEFDPGQATALLLHQLLQMLVIEHTVHGE